MWRRPATIISDYQQSSQNPNQNENQNQNNNDNNSYNQNQASISSRLSCSETMHSKEDIMEEKRKRRVGEEFRVGCLKVCVVKQQQQQQQRQQQRQQLKLSNMMKKKRPFGLHGNWLNSRQQQENHTLATLLLALFASTALIFASLPSSTFVSANEQVGANTIVSSQQQVATNSNAADQTVSSQLASLVGAASTGSAEPVERQQPHLQDMFAAASSNHQQQVSSYDQQKHLNNQMGPSKAKKIQIVYIKVPLAKLKPSLPANDYSAASGSGSNNSLTYGNNSNNGEQQHDTTETKSHGSQQTDQQQQVDENGQPIQQQHHHQQQQQQLSRQHSAASSFLIPMAVIQSAHEQGDSNSQLADQMASSVRAPHFESLQQSSPQQQQQQQQLPSSNQNNDNAFLEPPRGLFSMPPPPSPQQPRRSRQQQSPMQNYQNLLSSPSVNHGINHGFMSSFLQAEKEKLTTAAMQTISKQFQQHQPNVGLDTAASQASSINGSSTASQTTPSNVNQSPQQQQQQQPNTNAQQVVQHQQGQQHQQQNQQHPKPGGLMPMMMLPLSMMPDNMIGQAYNAATQQALSVESGSPTSMLSSSSSSATHTDNNNNNNYSNNNNNKHGNNNNYNGGGNAGIHMEGNTSHGTSSSASYGANGQNQHETGLLGNAYQQSGLGYAGSGQSSGYGNGINSFGASVAFSDYPTIQSSASGQQTYGQQSHSNNNNLHNNNNNSPNLHHNQLGDQGSADSLYASSKMRQAKKTIIPIVVQVEHAIMEANGNAMNQAYAGAAAAAAATATGGGNKGGNKYGGGRGNRHAGNGKRGNRGHKSLAENQPQQQQQQNGYMNNNNNHNNNNIPYGAATNDMPYNPLVGATNNGAQYINAANAQDINQITAQINAENAASAAAALAQADAAFGGGAPAYIGNSRPQQQQQNYNQGNNNMMMMMNQHHQQGMRPMATQYAQGLQSAASALLANTHPVIQAAASGGFASVSKLGAKLGEMMALPSMQVQNSISSIGSSLPSALSNIGNQMGFQLNQAVQQVAKEHPTAHAFARQVAQQAGLNLPNFQQSIQQAPQQQQQQQQVQNFGNHQQNVNNNNNNNNKQQFQQVAASNQYSQAVSPQAQLQNLKLSIGQNLQTAAAQLIGVHNKATVAQSAATMLANPLSALYPQPVSVALKQLSSLNQSPAIQSPSVGYAPNALNQMDPHHAQSSSIVSVQQQLNGQAGLQQQQQQQPQQQQQDSQASQFGANGFVSSLAGGEQQVAQASAVKPQKASLKSKFLSFFQPPKFISNFLSWNDRADERKDDMEINSADEQKSSLSGESNQALSGKQQQDKSEVEAKASNATTIVAPTTTSVQPSTTKQEQLAKVTPAAPLNVSTQQVITSTSLAPSSGQSSSTTIKAEQSSNNGTNLTNSTSVAPKNEKN